MDQSGQRDAGAKRQKRPRRSFTDEFKAQTVRLVIDEDKSVAQVARDLDIAQSVVGTWVKQARADRSRGKTGLTSAEREELARLRKENRELKMERDILKKAALGSRGRRNSSGDSLAWCEESEDLAGAPIQANGDDVEIVLCERGQIQPVREVLA